MTKFINRAVLTLFVSTLAYSLFSSTLGFAQGGRDPAMAVKKLDRNGDGKVSRREWKKKPSSVFDEIDTNADGLLTK